MKTALPEELYRAEGVCMGTFRPGLIRPGHLWQSFFLEPKEEKTDSRGKPITTYKTDCPQEIRGILTGASAREVAAYQQAGHPISHVITHRGRPIAKAGDRLIYQNRAFYVQGVDNPGELHVWTLYYCEERAGGHHGHHE